MIQNGQGDEGGGIRLWTWHDVVLVTAGGAVLTLLTVLLYWLHPMPQTLEAPEHPVEGVTLGWWSLGAISATGIVLLQRGRDRLGGLILLILSLLAILRELDLHARLEPEHLGRWGVEMKTDWWLEPTAPIWLKVGWFIVLALPPVLLVILAASQAAPVVRLIGKGDPSTMLLLLSGVLLAGGFACDDLLREATFISDLRRAYIEEWLELLGAAAFAACAVWSYAQPLHQRVARLESTGSG